MASGSAVQLWCKPKGALLGCIQTYTCSTLPCRPGRPLVADSGSRAFLTDSPVQTGLGAEAELEANRTALRSTLQAPALDPLGCSYVSQISITTAPWSDPCRGPKAMHPIAPAARSHLWMDKYALAWWENSACTRTLGRALQREAIQG